MFFLSADMIEVGIRIYIPIQKRLFCFVAWRSAKCLSLQVREESLIIVDAINVCSDERCGSFSHG